MKPAGHDGDGLSNRDERAFGLDPTRGASSNPIAIPYQPTAGTFSYTRRDPALTGLIYSVRTSADLIGWTEDTGAVQSPGTTAADGVQTVAVTLSPDLPATPKRFVRVKASEPEN